MDDAKRFEGQMAEEYELITLAYPDFDEFQRGICAAIHEHAPGAATLLEIGTGNGFTTGILRDEFPRIDITSLDNDEQMIRHATARFAAADARLELVHADALDYLSRCDAGAFDVVASAFTLHNMPGDYRDRLEPEIHRVLAPGGLFVNADKYAEHGQARFDSLGFQVERFFDAFVPLEKLELLRKWVVHNIADQSPRFVMYEDESVARLENLGYRKVSVSQRTHMQAVLVAVRGAERSR